MQGLLARAIEQHPSAKPMQIVRFTVDLWRAAPFAPVTLHVRTLREGKSAEWLEADLSHRQRDRRARVGAAAARRRRHRPARPRAARPGALEDASPRCAGSAHRDDNGSLRLRERDRAAPGRRLRAPGRVAAPARAARRGRAHEPVRVGGDAADMIYSLPIVRAVQRGARFERAAVRRDQRRHVAAAAPRAGRRVDRARRRGLLRPDGAGLGRAALADEDGALGFAQQSLLLRDAERRPSDWDERVRSRAAGAPRIARPLTRP
jgi:hypothetical protein